MAEFLDGLVQEHQRQDDLVSTVKVILTHRYPMHPKVPVKSQGICSICDVITFDQKKHRLCSRYGVGRDLSNDIQTSPIGLM